MQEISSREFAEWAAYYEIEPFGEERADLRAGVVASMVGNSAGGKQGGGSFEPADFVMSFGQRETDWRMMLAQAQMINTMFGGQDDR